MRPPRLCIIGNSHVACLRLAHAQPDSTQPDSPQPGSPLGDGPVDFFAASANRIGELRLADGRHFTPASRRVGKQIQAISGRKRIDLHAYDAFALVGVSIEYRDFLRLFQRFCLFRHAGWRAKRALISDACFTRWLEGLYGLRPAYRLAREIAAVRPGVPVLIATAPFPEARALFADKHYHRLSELRGTGYFEALAGLYRTCAAAAAASVGAGLSLPGAETQDPPGFTAPRYNRDGHFVRLDPTEQAATTPDPWHMNTDFGRLRLTDIAAGLGLSVSGGTAPGETASGGTAPGGTAVAALT